ncbi:dihydrofolate reductase family protein [Microbacterium sp. P04]|uniref:dihydrofolate reductase family protein n=1 Tax=Microbacterium sp. P04 TaxID=3366947 RepID=UPI0037457112
MRVVEVLPATGASYDLATPVGKAAIAELYALEGDYVRLNMITTLTGAASGSDGTSETLSSRVDRAILGVIRSLADVVIVGAQTVRVEGYLMPRATRLAVVTATGDLGGHRLGDGEGVLLVCPADHADAVQERADLPKAEVVPVPGSGDLEPAAIVAALGERSLGRIVNEGGPRLAGLFATAGAIDEYCVTVAPVLSPAQHPFLTLPSGTGPHTAPVGLLVDDAAFSYLRLRPCS